MNTEPKTPLKLELCPFCKSTDVVMTKHIYYGWKCFTPFCANCEAKGQVNIRYESDAAEKWNKLSQLERELSTANARIVELEQALTGRTVSCAACEEMADIIRKLRQAHINRGHEPFCQAKGSYGNPCATGPCNCILSTFTQTN